MENIFIFFYDSLHFLNSKKYVRFLMQRAFFLFVNYLTGFKTSFYLLIEPVLYTYIYIYKIRKQKMLLLSPSAGVMQKKLFVKRRHTDTTVTDNKPIVNDLSFSDVMQWDDDSLETMLLDKSQCFSIVMELLLKRFTMYFPALCTFA